MENKLFTPSFSVSELMIPGQQKKSMGFIGARGVAKGGWAKKPKPK